MSLFVLAAGETRNFSSRKHISELGGQARRVYDHRATAQVRTTSRRVDLFILLFGCVLNRASGDSYFSCLPPKRGADTLYWLMLQTNVLPFLTGAVHNGPRLVFALGTLIMALGPAAC